MGKYWWRSLQATFNQRKTAIPDGLPIALTPAFAQSPDKIVQWNAFLRKNRLTDVPMDIQIIISFLAEFLGLVFEAAAGRNKLSSIWPPGGPWKLAGEGKENNS